MIPGAASVEFMNEPFKFIMEHPEDFSEAMQAMAQYQFIAEQDGQLLGDLPMHLAEKAQVADSLLRKSMQAESLARVIMTADLPKMRSLASDAKFAEKKALFQVSGQVARWSGSQAVRRSFGPWSVMGQ